MPGVSKGRCMQFLLSYYYAYLWLSNLLSKFDDPVGPLENCVDDTKNALSSKLDEVKGVFTSKYMPSTDTTEFSIKLENSTYGKEAHDATSDLQDELWDSIYHNAYRVISSAENKYTSSTGIIYSREEKLIVQRPSKLVDGLEMTPDKRGLLTMNVSPMAMQFSILVKTDIIAADDSYCLAVAIRLDREETDRLVQMIDMD